MKNVRRLLTGISFLVFGAGSLNLAFTVLPLILLFSTDKEVRRKRIQNTISWHFRLFLKWMQALKLMRMDVSGVEQLCKNHHQRQGVLVIANHLTLIDVVVLMAYMPDVDCVVKAGLYRNFFLKKIVRAAGYIPNVNPQKLLSDCTRTLNEGRNLIIFPEGTRRRPGEPLRFQRGVSHIALQAGCYLRPVYLNCEPATLGKHQHWYDIPDKAFVFSLRVGELISVAP
nr:lysophospholipid acyltransferase family protein [Endozoicomonas sp.]